MEDKENKVKKTTSRKMEIDSQDFTIYYSNECPYVEYEVKELSDLIYDTSYHKDSKTAPPNKNKYKDRFYEYINAKLKGKENADFRKFSKSSVDLADTITHDTTNIDRKKTETAIVAIINLVNLISIIENKSTIC